MDNKQKFITQEVANNTDLIKFNLENATILPHTTIDFFQQQTNKEETIYIYDLGFKNTQKIIPVSNHINKTGTNPFRGKQKKPQFYDITQIYQKQNRAKIAVCFGEHTPKQENSNYIQTRFLCHHTVAAYCAGFKIIFAQVIN